MARTALGVSEVKKNNLPVIIVQCSPTSGGITASYGSLGDILIAESKDCQIMFAGPRVIKAANTSEVLHEYGNDTVHLHKLKGDRYILDF